MRRSFRTLRRALCNATLPYVRALASVGVKAALERDAGLAAGVNVCNGEIVHEAVAAGLLRTRRRELAA